MNFLRVKPSSFVLQSSSTVVRPSSRPKLCIPSVSFPRIKLRSKGRLGLRLIAYEPSKNDGPPDFNGDSKLPNGPLPKSRREILLEYVKNVQPELMELFVKRAPQQTSVTEPSASELAKLLYWLMVVGYSIRNIEVRFDMERVLGTPPKLAELPPGENI